MTEAGGDTVPQGTWDPGQEVAGRYRLVEPLAEGGMGAVYIAEHLVTRKRVALKLVFPHVAREVAGHERFLREAQAPAAIGHDRIVDVTDAGVDPEDGTLFLCMELLEGENLRDYLARDDVTLKDALERVVDLLAPLAAAHERGFVHRDLKPENVFVCREPDGEPKVKLLDFGITRQIDSKPVTQTGMAMGTVLYMSPEQARTARDVTTGSDVWSVGVLLYEILSGHVPFTGDTPFDVVLKATTERHRAISEHWPAAPLGLVELVDRCLAKDPQERPADAGALREELVARLGDVGEAGGHGVHPDERALAATATSDSPHRASTTDGVSIDARPAGLPARSGRRWLLAGAAALALIAAGVVFAVSTGGTGGDGGDGGATQAAAVAGTYLVDVTAEPAGATFFLDGERIEGPRLERELQKDGRTHALRVEAEGHRTEKLSFTDAPPPRKVVLPQREEKAEAEAATETATEAESEAEAETEAEAEARRRAERRAERLRRARRRRAAPAGGDEEQRETSQTEDEETGVEYGPNKAPVIP